MLFICMPTSSVAGFSLIPLHPLSLELTLSPTPLDYAPLLRSIHVATTSFANELAHPCFGVAAGPTRAMKNPWHGTYNKLLERVNPFERPLAW